MWNFGKSIPPSGWFGCGSGRKPVREQRPRSRISLRAHRRRAASQVVPAGSLTRTPSCTGLPRDIVTPVAGAVGEVVALGEQVGLPLHALGLAPPSCAP